MSWLKEFEALVTEGKGQGIEEFWLAKLEQGVEDPDPFLAATAMLRRAGRKKDADLLLELAWEQAREQKAWRAVLGFAKECLRLGVGAPGKLRADLEGAFRNLWAGRPSLESLLKHFDLPNHKEPAKACEELETWLRHDVGEVFAMAGRGPGRVVEANPKVGVLRLDFEREKRVPVPIGAASRYLTPLPPGHFLRRRLEEPERLRQELLADPPGALRELLLCYPDPLTVADIRDTIGPLLGDGEWSSWWNKAKQSNDLLAEGKGSNTRYRVVRGGTVEDVLSQRFAEAPLEEKVALARKVKRGTPQAQDMARVLLARARGAPPGEAFAAIQAARRLGAPEADLAEAWSFLRLRVDPVELLAELGEAGDREALLKNLAEENRWESLAAWMDRETNPRLLGLVAEKLLEVGQQGLLQRFLSQVFLHPARYAAAWVWALETTDGPVATLVAAKQNAAALVKLVDAGERKEFAPYRARIRELLNPSTWVGRVLREELTEELASRLYHILQSPGVLQEERGWLKRVLLARFPNLAGQPSVSETIPALEKTVRWLQDTLANLLYKEIPATLKAIQLAREEGDLRENFEYHAQRERQEQLSSRAAKIQADLAKIQIIVPSQVDPSQVRVGCQVDLLGQGHGGQRRVVILGPYEADPAAGIYSHASEVGQKLLGRKVGEEVEVDGERFHIAGIAPVDEGSVVLRERS